MMSDDEKSILPMIAIGIYLAHAISGNPVTPNGACIYAEVLAEEIRKRGWILPAGDGNA
jgi:hypothetical protein